MSLEGLELAYLKALLESAGFLKAGGGLSGALSVPKDLYVVIPFIVQLAIASELFIEGEVYVDGELFVE
jgi:hypothetical protein